MPKLADIKKIPDKVRYLVLLLRSENFQVIMKQLKRQVYSRDIQVGLALNIQEVNIPPVPASIEYSLHLASEDDMDELLQKRRMESKEGIRWLTYGKWLYECGFRNCYLARTKNNNDLCYMHFVIHPKELKIMGRSIRRQFPDLKEDEVLFECAYTFKNYKGNRLGGSVLVNVLDTYRKKGFKRAIVYMSKDKSHINAISRIEASGFKKFEEVSQLKTLFFTSRRSRPYQQPKDNHDIQN